MLRVPNGPRKTPSDWPQTATDCRIYPSFYQENLDMKSVQLSGTPGDTKTGINGGMDQGHTMQCCSTRRRHTGGGGGPSIGLDARQLLWCGCVREDRKLMPVGQWKQHIKQQSAAHRKQSKRCWELLGSTHVGVGARVCDIRLLSQVPGAHMVHITCGVRLLYQFPQSLSFLVNYSPVTSCGNLSSQVPWSEVLLLSSHAELKCTLSVAWYQPSLINYNLFCPLGSHISKRLVADNSTPSVCHDTPIVSPLDCLHIYKDRARRFRSIHRHIRSPSTTGKLIWASISPI